MKALPIRKGNLPLSAPFAPSESASMKAFPKRKGNSWRWSFRGRYGPRLNESPSEKEGKCGAAIALVVMKGMPQ